MDVTLVRVTNHTHYVVFGAYSHTDSGTASISDYVRQDAGGHMGAAGHVNHFSLSLIPVAFSPFGIGADIA